MTSRRRTPRHVKTVYKLEIELPNNVDHEEHVARVESVLAKAIDAARNFKRLFAVFHDDDGQRVGFTRIIERRRPLKRGLQGIGSPEERKCCGCGEMWPSGDVIAIGSAHYLCSTCEHHYESPDATAVVADGLAKDLGA